MEGRPPGPIRKSDRTRCSSAATFGPAGMTFYTGTTFPSEYHGSAFAAFHGSSNRAARTGYKVVRIIMRDGVPTGEYEDFLIGFVVDNNRNLGAPGGCRHRDGRLPPRERRRQRHDLARGAIIAVGLSNSLALLKGAHAPSPMIVGFNSRNVLRNCFRAETGNSRSCAIT